MRLSGKIRYRIAMLLVSLSVLALAIGSWLFFGAYGEALVSTAAGSATPEGNLMALIALQKQALILVVIMVVLLGLALVMLFVNHESRVAQIRALRRRIEDFVRGDWDGDGEPMSEDRELGEIAIALDTLASAMRARSDGLSGGLRSAEDIKSRFLEIIAHQLRTPLTAVRWNLEALTKGDLGPLKKRQLDLLEITSKNYQGILVMLSDWVEALEVERGLLQLNLEPVDLRDLFSSMVHDFQSQARLKRQKLVVRLSRGLPKVYADHLKLRYILTKLLSNAMGYTPERGSVSVRVLVEGKAVRVEVTDTGVGIPYEDQPNVFKKFFRASNAALMQPNASGVGLFVAKTLVDAMGGTISFKSQEGRGTTFWFTVPSLTIAPKR